MVRVTAVPATGMVAVPVSTSCVIWRTMASAVTSATERVKNTVAMIEPAESSTRSISLNVIAPFDERTVKEAASLRRVSCWMPVSKSNDPGITSIISCGAEVGIRVGLAVGACVGTELGDDVGTHVGDIDGLADGIMVGGLDGSEVGLAVGVCDGDTEGESVGSEVGSAVGARDGATEGA